MYRLSIAITNRARHAKAIWSQSPWMRWVGAAWMLWTFFTFWRDEIADPTIVEQYRVVRIMPHLPLAWWLAIGLAILLIGLFEATYRLRRSDLGAIDVLKRNRPRLETALVKHLEQWWLEVRVSDAPCICTAQIDFRETSYTGFSGAPVGAYWRSHTLGNSSNIITGSRDRIFLYGTTDNSGKIENEFRFFNNGNESKSHGFSPWDKVTGPSVADTGILNVYVESNPPAIDGPIHKRFRFSGFKFEEL